MVINTSKIKKGESTVGDVFPLLLLLFLKNGIECILVGGHRVNKFFFLSFFV